MIANCLDSFGNWSFLYMNYECFAIHVISVIFCSESGTVTGSKFSISPGSLLDFFDGFMLLFLDDCLFDVYFIIHSVVKTSYHLGKRVFSFSELRFLGGKLEKLL